TAIYWNAENVNYETDIKKILEYNIHAEEEAIKKYELHLSLIHDKYIQALIQRIIIDEKEHILIFKKLQNEIK
ncbi:MAG: rubrerythrin, partial [Firmicutes bacterium]|nr:rubrerythrin [Bacillota bacterium]